LAAAESLPGRGTASPNGIFAELAVFLADVGEALLGRAVLRRARFQHAILHGCGDLLTLAVTVRW